MFKLLALRVLDGCDKHIRKCLKSNVYYYFCTDFRFEFTEKIYRRDKYSKSLPEYFFSIPTLNSSIPESAVSPVINVNAIVGKNGDGKSTIVELVVRMINDYVAKRQKQNIEFNEGRELLIVGDVNAELYLQLDSSIYKLLVTNEIHVVKKIANITEEYSFNIIDEEAPTDIFSSIYTFVSNYSHYAYNIFDFEREWNKPRKELSTEDEMNEACWLFHVFHKNDGYSTPISLHPYRKSGIIDINKEAKLSKQRLLYLFINSSNDENSFRNIIEGQKASALRLKEAKGIKLQDRSIIDHFKQYEKEDTSLSWIIDPIEVFAEDIKINPHRNEFELKKMKSKYFDVVSNVLKYVIDGEGCESPIEYQSYLLNAFEWLGDNFLSNSDYLRDSMEQSNITQYFDNIYDIWANIKCKNHHLYLPKEEDKTRYSVCRRYNIRQLARLRTIYDIAKLHQFDPELCFSQNELSPANKCRLYMIYKTISIFETYPEYTAIHKKYIKKDGMSSCIEYYMDELNELWDHLIHDKSHITRKYRQCQNYLSAHIANGNRDVYRLLATKNTKELKSHIDIPLDVLQSFYGKSDDLLEKLPPAIFETEILFDAGETDYIKMSDLSSGEKQILGTIGAIIYHLQNIDSSKTKVKYTSVNLMLEEIELYFHPEFQRKYVQRLIRQIHGADLQHIRNVNITFVTHSPFVLSDIPKCNVLFLKDGMPDYQMQENTFGANIHSLLKNGFFLPNLPMGEFAYQKTNQIFRILNEYLYKELDTEQIDLIKQEINLLGEPYLRGKLYELLNMRYHDIHQQ